MSYPQSSSNQSRTSDIDAVDIGQILDQGRFGFLQQFFLVLIALIIIIEGIDIQLVAYAMPQILRDWQIERADFGLAATANSVGLFAGTLMAGYIADRMGRRFLLLMSLFVCGGATFMVGLSHNPDQVALWRLITGIGIGGALPVCTTMIAEFAPQRYRTLAVTLAIICIPLGGILAGVFADLVLNPLGWEKMFFIGGLTPLGLWLVSLLSLPESPRFLSRTPARWGELCRLLARLGKPVAAQSRFIDREEHYQGEGSKFDLTALFTKGLARDTLVLWVLCFACMIGSYAIFAWLPAMLQEVGMDAKSARFSLILYNLGGIIGIAICAHLLARFGSKLVMGLCALGGLVTIAPLFWFNIADQVHLTLSLISIHGVFANAINSTLFAFSAHLYVTQIRATGATTAQTSGRIGGIIAIKASAYLAFGSYVLMLICAMSILLLAVFCLRRHMAPVKTDQPIIGNVERQIS